MIKTIEYKGYWISIIANPIVSVDEYKRVFSTQKKERYIIHVNFGKLDPVTLSNDSHIFLNHHTSCLEEEVINAEIEIKKYIDFVIESEQFTFNTLLKLGFN